MAKLPCVEVQLHRRIEPRGPQVRLQHGKRRGRLLVDDRPIVQLCQAVAVALDGLIHPKTRREEVAQLVDPSVLEVFEFQTSGQVVAVS